jgi:hypothetical protein
MFDRSGKNDPPPPPADDRAAAAREPEHAGAAQSSAPPPPAPAGRAESRPPAGPAPRTGDADAVVLDRDARLRQRDEYGGINWGAAFFGWVVAIGIAVLLTAIVSAAGAAIGLTDAGAVNDASSNPDTVSIVGGALLIVIAVIAYYAGGYVAGRMSRFDGARQGLGVWVFGLVMTLVIAAAGAIVGDEYNVLDRLNLPRIPVNAGDLTTGGLIALAAIAVGSLLGAMAGGKIGERYHRKVDRAALVD